MVRSLRQVRVGNQWLQVDDNSPQDPVFDGKNVSSNLTDLTLGSPGTIAGGPGASGILNLYSNLAAATSDLWRLVAYNTNPQTFVLETKTSGSWLPVFTVALDKAVTYGAAIDVTGDVESNGALLLKSNTTTPSATQAAISYNDTTKALSLKDNGTVTYILGYNHRGDPAAVDYTLASFTADATWRDLNLSSIVPAGAKSVVLAVRVNDLVPGTKAMFRKNGLSNAINVSTITTQVASLDVFADMTIGCDSSRIVEYNIAAAMDSIDVTVKGWFI